MNTNGTHSLPNDIGSTPEGWYPEPTTGVGQRYWDGQQWTEHVCVSGQQYVSPLPETEHKAKKKIYWSNLFRFRTWWFSISSSTILVVLMVMVGIPGSVAAALWIPLIVAIGYFWIHQQMACGSCGTLLRVTRLSGAQQVCQKCGNPTDHQ